MQPRRLGSDLVTAVSFIWCALYSACSLPALVFFIKTNIKSGSSNARHACAVFADVGESFSLVWSVVKTRKATTSGGERKANYCTVLLLVLRKESKRTSLRNTLAPSATYEYARYDLMHSNMDSGKENMELTGWQDP
jgi:hypothetical protein